ncbi:MAG: hypothetical protein ACRCX2_28915 [Paraclostridium sp.]
MSEKKLEELINKYVDSEKEVEFYNFIGDKLSVVSSACKDIGAGKEPKALLFMVKDMVKMLSNCLDIKAEEYIETNIRKGVKLDNDEA